MLQQVLRNNLVAEQICEVDRTDNMYIYNPYGSQPTTTVTTLTGTYIVNDYTVTVDTLTITDEFKSAEHVKDFEQVLNNYNLFRNRASELAYSVAAKIDNYVLNALVTDGTGTYTTPTGGFTTASNILTIMANLQSKCAGYADAYKGTYLVVESTDMVGFSIAGATNGFTMADRVLNDGFNGQKGSMMGTDIYFVPSGTFNSNTIGTKTMAASGHRLFGVKNITTYAAPRGVQFEEKSVSGKTGKEVVAWGYLGVKVWACKAALIVDITLA